MRGTYLKVAVRASFLLAALGVYADMATGFSATASVFAPSIGWPIWVVSLLRFILRFALCFFGFWVVSAIVRNLPRIGLYISLGVGLAAGLRGAYRYSGPGDVEQVAFISQLFSTLIVAGAIFAIFFAGTALIIIAFYRFIPRPR